MAPGRLNTKKVRSLDMSLNQIGISIRFSSPNSSQNIFLLNCPQDAFGGDDDGAINIKIELDFAWPTAGPVQIICKGDAGDVQGPDRAAKILA